jgi:hypothetical protein
MRGLDESLPYRIIMTFMGYMEKSIRSNMARNYNCSTTFNESILWNFNELWERVYGIHGKFSLWSYAKLLYY